MGWVVGKVHGGRAQTIGLDRAPAARHQTPNNPSINLYQSIAPTFVARQHAHVGLVAQHPAPRGRKQAVRQIGPADPAHRPGRGFVACCYGRRCRVGGIGSRVALAQTEEERDCGGVEEEAEAR